MRVLRSRFALVLAVLVSLGPLVAPPTVHAVGPVLAAVPPADASAPDLGSLLWTLPFIVGIVIRKDIGAITAKFVQRAGAAGTDYKTGVEASAQDWQTNTLAAEDNYAAGVQQAVADKRFGKGVGAAGAQKFREKAGTLGAQRYPTGVAASAGEFQKGLGPVLDTLKGLTLPPRRPTGDPGNQERSNTVARALRAMKVGR